MTTVTSAITKPVEDSEWHRTAAKESVYALINTVGTSRNILCGVQSGFELAKVLDVAAKLFGTIFSYSQIVGGVLYIGSACFHTIPDAKEEYRLAVKSQDPAAIFRAKLGLANQGLYLSTGCALTMNGLANPTVASTLHTNTAGTVVAGASAATVATGALAGIYIVRGAVILSRAHALLEEYNKYDEQFQGWTEGLEKANIGNLNKKLEQAIIMAKADPATSSFGKCVDDHFDESPLITPKDKIEYLAKIEKGIYSKKMQQELAKKIAWSMIIGGLILLAALFLCSGPQAILILGIVASVFFTAMESIYLTNDLSPLFKAVRDKNYTESATLKHARQVLAEFEIRESNPLLRAELHSL